MNSTALVLVIASAVLHVGWNTAVRDARGGVRFVWLLCLGAAATGLLCSGGALLSPGLWQAWPWLAGGTTLNALYFLALGRAYAFGDLSWAYPILRGSAVAFAAPLALLLFAQGLPPSAWAGIALVLAGVAAMQIPAGARRARNAPLSGALSHGRPRLAVLWPLLGGLMVAGYSLLDSRGVRTAPPLPYAGLEYLGSALALTPFAFRGARPAGPPGRRTRHPLRPAVGPPRAVRPPAWEPPVALSRLKADVCRGQLVPLGAGAVSLASYVLLLYAYRLAPVAEALAVRQLAPSLAAVVGTLVLRERVNAARLLGTAAIIAGTLLIVLAGH